jgi:hypothetical protein
MLRATRQGSLFYLNLNKSNLRLLTYLGSVPTLTAGLDPVESLSGNALQLTTTCRWAAAEVRFMSTVLGVCLALDGYHLLGQTQNVSRQAVMCPRLLNAKCIAAWPFQTRVDLAAESNLNQGRLPCPFLESSTPDPEIDTCLAT